MTLHCAGRWEKRALCIDGSIPPDVLHVLGVGRAAGTEFYALFPHEWLSPVKFDIAIGHLRSAL